MKKHMLLAFFLGFAHSALCMQGNLISSLQKTSKLLHELQDLLKVEAKVVAPTSWKKEFQSLLVKIVADPKFLKNPKIVISNLELSEQIKTFNDILLKIISLSGSLGSYFDDFLNSRKELNNFKLLAALIREKYMPYLMKAKLELIHVLENIASSKNSISSEEKEQVFYFLTLMSRYLGDLYNLTNKFVQNNATLFSFISWKDKDTQHNITAQEWMLNFVKQLSRDLMRKTPGVYCHAGGLNCDLLPSAIQYLNSGYSAGSVSAKESVPTKQALPNIGDEVNAYFSTLDITKLVENQWSDKNLKKKLKKFTQVCNPLFNGLHQFGENLTLFADFIATHRGNVAEPQEFIDLVAQFRTFFSIGLRKDIQEALADLISYGKDHTKTLQKTDKEAVAQWLGNFDRYLHKLYEKVGSFKLYYLDEMKNVFWKPNIVLVYRSAYDLFDHYIYGPLAADAAEAQRGPLKGSSKVGNNTSLAYMLGQAHTIFK